jgi:hypothetical protein
MNAITSAKTPHARLFILIQWTGALVALVGSFLVGCGDPRERFWGFWLFLFSNVLWILWARRHAAWGLLVMQLAFCVTSVRGIIGNN